MLRLSAFVPERAVARTAFAQGCIVASGGPARDECGYWPCLDMADTLRWTSGFRVGCGGPVNDLRASNDRGAIVLAHQSTYENVARY